MRRFAALALFFIAAAAAADARLDQARREGEVVWYTAMNVPDAEAVRAVRNVIPVCDAARTDACPAPLPGAMAPRQTEDVE